MICGYARRMNPEELREAMVGALQTSPCRSRELFKKVAADERAGREALSSLIDDGRVVVETDWTLRLR